MKTTGKIFAPADPHKPFTAVCARDIADAAAAILVNPTSHVGKQYVLAGPSFTYAHLALSLTMSLGKPILYSQVSYEDAKEAFLNKGWPQSKVSTVLPLHGHSLSTFLLSHAG